MQSCLFVHKKDTAEFLADHQQTNKTGFSCNSTRVRSEKSFTYTYILHCKYPSIESPIANSFANSNVFAVFRAFFLNFKPVMESIKWSVGWKNVQSQSMLCTQFVAWFTLWKQANSAVWSPCQLHLLSCLGSYMSSKLFSANNVVEEEGHALHR